MDDNCKCARREDILFAIREDANEFALKFSENFADKCTILAFVAAREYISRLAHILVMMDDIDETGTSDRTTTNSSDTHVLVQEKLTYIAKDIDMVIARVMSDRDREVHSARH